MHVILFFRSLGNFRQKSGDGRNQIFHDFEDLLKYEWLGLNELMYNLERVRIWGILRESGEIMF